MNSYIFFLSLCWLRRFSAEELFTTNPPLKPNEEPYAVPPFHGGDHPQILHSIQGYNSDAGCQSTPGSATVFVEFSENILEDYSDGARTPLKSSCAPCKTGTRFSYAPLPKNQDLDELIVGDIRDIVVGGYRCVNNSKLCVESTDGSYYRANSERVVIWPVPFLKNRKPVMLAILDPTESLKELIGAKIEYGRDQLQSSAPLKYKNGHDHPYIEIEGISCNSCQGAMNHCPSLSVPARTQLRSNDWRVPGTHIRPPGESPSLFVPPVIERTGYSYNGPETYSAGTYGEPQTSVTEEPYSNLGYEENSVYIQPDGMNPYLDTGFEKKRESDSNPMGKTDREQERANGPRFSVFRSSPAPITSQRSFQDRDDGREIEILDRQIVENGPVTPIIFNIRRAPITSSTVKISNEEHTPVLKSTTTPPTFSSTRAHFNSLNFDGLNVLPTRANLISLDVPATVTFLTEQTATQLPSTQPMLVDVAPIEPNLMSTPPPMRLPVSTVQFETASEREISSTPPSIQAQDASSTSPPSLFSSSTLFPWTLPFLSLSTLENTSSPSTARTVSLVPNPVDSSKMTSETSTLTSSLSFDSTKNSVLSTDGELQGKSELSETFANVGRETTLTMFVPVSFPTPIIQEQSDHSEMLMMNQMKPNNGDTANKTPPHVPTAPPQQLLNVPNVQTLQRDPNTFFRSLPTGDFENNFVPQLARFPELLSPIEQSLLINSIVAPSVNGPLIMDRGQVQSRQFLRPAGPPGVSEFFISPQTHDSNRWRTSNMVSMEPVDFQVSTTLPSPVTMPAARTFTLTAEKNIPDSTTAPFEFKIMEPQPLISGPIPPPKKTAFEQKEVQFSSISKDGPPSQIPTWQWLMEHPARMRALLRRRKMLL